MDGTLFDRHLNLAEIEAGMPHVLSSPKNDGVLELIVRRPKVNAREVVQTAELNIVNGLVGDNWLARGSSRTNNGLGHPEMQLNIMNSRIAALVAGGRERMKLAGDQLFVDLDLSEDNVPPGTRLAIGTAVVQVTSIPHLGCKKFVERFGLEAMKFVNSDLGRKHHLRGINAKVVTSGSLKVGDIVRKLS
jgi:Uncharacterized protein conserved in bacteria